MSPFRTSRFGFSMRWWLALAFAAIVALAAIVVAEMLTQRSESAFRSRARELAVGTAVTAAGDLRDMESGPALATATAREARNRRIALFLFDHSGRLLTPRTSLAVDLRGVERHEQVVANALKGDRSVDVSNGGRRIIVALPVHGAKVAALVGVASRPDLVAAGQILHGNVVGAVALAIVVGAAVGLVVAFFITSRLRRIARTAGEIERGNFELALEPGFNDELGQLAQAIDRMRERLRDSFLSLRGERDRLERLLEQLQEGVVAVDRELRVVFANGRARLLLERRLLQEGDELPDPWPDLSLREVAGRLFTPGASISSDRVPVRPARTYSVTGVPARWGVNTAVLVITDISQQERRERAEREFVTNAAHELRTPLSAIAGAVEALRSGAKEMPRERDRFLEIVARQTERLGRLVRALLALARAQTGVEQLRLEPVTVRPLLVDLAAEASERGTEVVIECDPELQVLAHGDLLRQAIGNLVSNALKYAGGELRLSAESVEGDRVRLEVSDRGAGLDPEEAERIVERFYRSGARGSDGFGLGLPIVREVVRALGGQFEIDSLPGTGTRMRITLAKVVEA
jgi:two-component system sensor histidine kinase VicK